MALIAAVLAACTTSPKTPPAGPAQTATLVGPPIQVAAAIAPPPPVVVAAPQAPFQVLFGFGSAKINAEGKAVIAEAAKAFKTIGATAISVIGHADTVGSARANQALSERRAAGVKRALVEDGVPESAITASGMGSREPVVSTGEGVKEAQNRTAVIQISGPN